MGEKAGGSRFFHTRAMEMPLEHPTLRTRVYIDGYNLYYGRLRGTAYKWLDPLNLFERQILPSVLYQPGPDSGPAAISLLPLGIKYFSACILESAAKADDSVACQDTYHNALTRLHPGRIAVIKGYYSLTQVNQKVVSTENPRRWPRYCESNLVWKLEEKQSDVNLALHLFDDALSGDIDQAVVVTNDTDIAPALEFVKRRTDVVVGLVVPAHEEHAIDEGERRVNIDLRAHADWIRAYITAPELEASQLPTVVKGFRRNSIKPSSWYLRPDLIAKIVEMALPIKGSRGEVLKWMENSNPHMGNARPIKLAETEKGAALVLEYIENFIRDRIAK